MIPCSRDAEKMNTDLLMNVRHDQGCTDASAVGSPATIRSPEDASGAIAVEHGSFKPARLIP